LQPLDLYATIEQYLGFEEEIHHLYKEIGHSVLQHQPKTLIDIGCGQGEFCYIMNYNGIKTYGVDLSCKQIELAKQKDENLNVQCKDIKDVKEKFDCATAIFDVLNYIPPKQLHLFLEHTYNLLNDDGYFVFDINSLYGFENIAQGLLTIPNDDLFISIDALYEDNILNTTITTFQKQKDNLYEKQEGVISQYYHCKESLRKLLEDVGFKIKNIKNINLHSEDEADKYIFITQKVQNGKQ